MTNNPRKINELAALEIVVSERVPCITPPNSNFSLAYVKAKKERMFHMIDGEILQTSPTESTTTEVVVLTTTSTEASADTHQ